MYLIDILESINDVNWHLTTQRVHQWSHAIFQKIPSNCQRDDGGQNDEEQRPNDFGWLTESRAEPESWQTERTDQRNHHTDVPAIVEYRLYCSFWA